MKTKWFAVTIAVACATVGACSNASSDNDGGLSLPVDDAGLLGCTPTAAGCYTNEGKAYATPKVSASCSPTGEAAQGPADTHCKGVAPQAVNAMSCGVSVEDAGASDAASNDAGPDTSAPLGVCGENSDYGTTMYGYEGDDDDCKYHVTYTTTPVCQNDGTYFIVTAHYLTREGAPLTGACAFAELCLSSTHVAPNIDQRPPTGSQTVVEGPAGTYTIGPVEFDEPGDWTVRFHFNELCCDVLPSSPHGHAAFHVNVP